MFKSNQLHQLRIQSTRLKISVPVYFQKRYQPNNHQPNITNQNSFLRFSSSVDFNIFLLMTSYMFNVLYITQILNDICLKFGLNNV